MDCNTLITVSSMNAARFPHFPIDMDEAVLKVGILTAHNGSTSPTRIPVCMKMSAMRYTRQESISRDIEQPLNFNRCKKIVASRCSMEAV